MNKTAVKGMVLKSDRRLSAEGLAQLLLATPIIIVTKKGTKMQARMGLGQIVYIKPIRGRIRDVQLGADVYRDVSRCSNVNNFFSYQKQNFDVSYLP